jgi:hypothetical protein
MRVNAIISLFHSVETSRAVGIFLKSGLWNQPSATSCARSAIISLFHLVETFQAVGIFLESGLQNHLMWVILAVRVCVTLSARRVGFHLSEAGHAELHAEHLSISGRDAEGEPLPFEMMGQSRNKSKLFWLAFLLRPLLYHSERCE